MSNKFVNGSTLLGVALALFALKDIGGTVNWQYWVMVLSSIFFLCASIKEYWFSK